MVCCDFDTHINVQQIVIYQTSLPHTGRMCHVIYVILYSSHGFLGKQNIADKNGAKVTA